MELSAAAKTRCVDCPIRQRAVCSRCDDLELARLDSIKIYKRYEAGQPINWRGDKLAYFSSIVSGVATVSKTLPDGRVQMVGLLLASDFIGRPGRSVSDFDVVAATDVMLCCFKREPFERLLIEIPHIAQRMLEMVLDEVDASREWMVLLGRKTAREKIASFLEMIVRRSSVSVESGQTFVLPLSRAEIANFLGLTLETVSRQFSSLKKDGVITFNDRRHFILTDPAALYIACGDDEDGSIIV